MIKGVEDLEVYNRSMNLLPSVYRLANSLPRGEFKRKRQLTDAAGSVSALIAEGFGKRRSEKEFKRFLGMALGSSDEVITHIRQIKIIGFPKASIQDCDTLVEEYKIVSKQINTLIKVWKNFGPQEKIGAIRSSGQSDPPDRKMMI